MSWRSFSSTRYIEGVCLGVLLFSLFMSATVLVAFYNTEVLVDLENYFFGTVAIFAAFLTLVGIRRQIQSNLELADAARERKLAALKAFLPLTLSDIYNECLVAINCFWAPGNGPAIDWKRLSDRGKELSIVIEFADKLSARDLTKVLATMQIARARTEELAKSEELFLADDQDRVILDNHITFRSDAIAEWVRLGRIVESLFPYARGETDETRVRWDSSPEKLKHWLESRVDLTPEKNPIYQSVLRKLEDR